MRRCTLVIYGGDLGAKLALAFAKLERLAPLNYAHRKDGSVQVFAMASMDDTGARNRWARRCRREGLTVAKAPWEKETKRHDTTHIEHAHPGEIVPIALPKGEES